MVTCALLASACERGFTSRVNYADTPDLAAAKRAFNCEASPQGSTVACDAIEAFEGGEMLKAYPEEGRTLFLGRKYCATDRGNSIVFMIAALRAGTSPAEVDALHRPKGVLSISMHSFSRNPAIKGVEAPDRAAEQTVQALAEGVPTLALGLPTDHFFPTSFERWQELAQEAPNTPHLTAESDGKSLLDNPGSIGAWWDDFDRSQSLYFVRELADGGFIRLMPTDSMSAEPRGDSCVTHFYPLPS